MSQPEISVLIPIYNVERYLDECLASLANQTFIDFEAICINDGSTDESAAIAQGYAVADKRFRVINKPNSGYGASMNVGLAQAQGRYIAILESDDIMLPHALKTLHATATKYDADVVKGNFLFYWSDPAKPDIFHEMITPDMTGRLIDTQEDLRIYYQKSSIWSGLYRREFLKQFDIAFLETPGASYQDTSFAFKIWAAARRATFVHEPIIQYRQDNESSSVNSKGKVYCVCEEYAEIARWLNKREDLAKKENTFHIALVAKYNAYLWNYDRLAIEYRAEFLQKMREEFSWHIDKKELDWKRWDAWRTLNLEYILNDPDKYDQIRSSMQSNSTKQKVLFALKLGGIPALLKVVSSRLSH